MTITSVDLKKYIRDIPDFPKAGILFRDITPLLGNPEAFRSALEQLADRFKDQGITKIAGIESRGFITAAPVCHLLNIGLIPIRKKGKLPAKTTAVTYQLEYGEDTLEMHEDAFEKGETVLVLDDLLATGGTAQATCTLIEKNGGVVAGVGFLIELTALKGREKLKGYNVQSLVSY